ncbi:MAG TPA: dipeptidase PepV [Selenomonadales bacterium]|nr:dipeptidase PepV [Selenomonadales bacterium]
MNELNAKVESLRDELLKLVQESVKINSVQSDPEEGMPFGPGPAKALAHALAVSADMGFQTANLENYIGYAEYGEGEEYVAVLGHLDIVPEGKGWKYPPFGGEIHEGKLYARGAIDDKGPIFASLIALKAIKELGLPLSKRVRIIYGTNEETGCKDAEYYITKEKAPASGFTPDGMFPVIHAEKGIFNFYISKRIAPDGPVRLKHIKGGERSNMVPDYCEATVAAPNAAELVKACEEYAKKNSLKLSATLQGGDVVLQSHGVSAHGSTPELGVNAIMQLLGFLGLCGFTGDAAQFVAGMNKLVGRETEGKSLGIGFADEPSGKLSCNAGLISLEGDTVKVTCNVRFPVTVPFTEIFQALQKTVAQENLEVACDRHTEPLYFPKDHPLVVTLHRIFVEESGIQAAPLAIGGGTYAKTIPNIVAYGPEFPGKTMTAHEANEYIEVDELMLSAKIYAQAIYELAK